MGGAINVESTELIAPIPKITLSMRLLFNNAYKFVSLDYCWRNKVCCHNNLGQHSGDTSGGCFEEDIYTITIFRL